MLSASRDVKLIIEILKMSKRQWNFSPLVELYCVNVGLTITQVMVNSNTSRMRLMYKRVASVCLCIPLGALWQ